MDSKCWKIWKNRHDTWRRRKIKPGFIIERIFLQVMLIDVLKSNKIFNSNTEIKKIASICQPSIKPNWKRDSYSSHLHVRSITTRSTFLKNFSHDPFFLPLQGGGFFRTTKNQKTDLKWKFENFFNSQDL